jgi:3-oxoadipate CoA-transferase beta subunit
MNRLNRDQMAARVARDIPEGAYVNLGIGLPTRVVNFLPKDREIFLQSENGLLGMGPAPAKEDVDWDLINAGKEPVTLLTGGAFFHHGDSFAMMRGGHLTSASWRVQVTPTAISRTGFRRPGRIRPSAGRWTSRSARRRCS